MDSTSPLRQYRSPASYRDNRQGLGGTSRGTWEKRAVAGRRSSRKWPRHRNDGERRRRGGKRINARRYTEEGNPGNAFANQSSSPGARISSKEPFVFPSRLPIPRFLPIPFYLFFLIYLLCVCLVLLHASTRAPPRFRFPPLRSYNPIVGVESRLAGKGTTGKKKRDRRETR